jgi:hypothetical protein
MHFPQERICHHAEEDFPDRLEEPSDQDCSRLVCTEEPRHPRAPRTTRPELPHHRRIIATAWALRRRLRILLLATGAATRTLLFVEPRKTTTNSKRLLLGAAHCYPVLHRVGRKI